MALWCFKRYNTGTFTRNGLIVSTNVTTTSGGPFNFFGVLGLAINVLTPSRGWYLLKVYSKEKKGNIRGCCCRIDLLTLKKYWPQLWTIRFRSCGSPFGLILVHSYNKTTSEKWLKTILSSEKALPPSTRTQALSVIFRTFLLYFEMWTVFFICKKCNKNETKIVTQVKWDNSIYHV